MEFHVLLDFIQTRLRMAHIYQSNRGNFIWSHRRKSARYISGTLKYEVLKAQSSVVNSAASPPMKWHWKSITSSPATKRGDQ
jgi:hypothetical protein